MNEAITDYSDDSSGDEYEDEDSSDEGDAKLFGKYCILYWNKVSKSNFLLRMFILSTSFFGVAHHTP